jgi:hypothetical protein
MKILTLLLTICSFILGPVNAQEIILDNYEAHFEKSKGTRICSPEQNQILRRRNDRL